MTDSRRRILITGATGGIGLLLTRRLRDDYDVVQQGRTPATEEQERELRRADLDDYEQVRPLMEGVDTVLHLAGAFDERMKFSAVMLLNCRSTSACAPAG